MRSPLWVLILVIDFFAAFSGIALNVGIVIVHMKNWRQHLAGGCDKVVLTMASVNALLQVILIYGGLLFSQALLLLDLPFSPFLFTFLSLIDFCFWNTSWLSVCYCLKLVNFSQLILLWMKSRLSSAVNVLLLGSTLGSILFNLPLLWWTATEVNLNFTGNSTVTDYRFDFYLYFLVVKIIFGTCLPFLFTFLCILLSVKSLLRHIWKIQKNSSDIKYSQLHGHIRAIRTMILLLFLDMTFCVSVTEVKLLSLDIGNFLGTITWIIILLYPSLQSVILITGNPKLQKHFYCQRRKRPGPSDA